MNIVTKAKYAGFCYGVERAVALAMEAARSGMPAWTLGHIIHNKSVVEELERLGVRAVNNAGEVPYGDTVIIRSHGITPQEFEALRQRTDRIIDATCPHVKKNHELAEARRDRLIIIFGDEHHAEVIGLAARCTKCVIAGDGAALPESSLPVTLIAQTTADKESYKKCGELAKKLYTNAEILDTICRATYRRQSEAMELAEKSDAMVVVGDENSSNARHLRDVCMRKCENVFLIERAEDLPSLKGCSRIGLTAGASTPNRRIEEVYKKMTEEIKNAGNTETEKTPAGESFEELLEQSLKSLNTGDKVTGVITNITPAEIYVDLGTKHAGYITITELSDDPEYKVEEHIHVGDEIECYVVRVNDVEGVAMLSKRRLDTVKSWEDVESASGTNAVLEGIVTEENKGGIVVSVKGVRVFVPASQTGLPKDAPMSDIMRKKVKLRITEFNRGRRRVVGSIRAVQHEDRRAKSEEIWANIETGKKYDGVVKSLTSYGAFVDIGGVDGMVHVSELSWTRVRQPGDIVKVGDPISVYVLSFDPEKKKISLGHKQAGDNPWNKFTQTFKVGDKTKVKVVKLMPFGAFAEVMPGVDGLIHISQITDRRIGKPGDAVNEGDEVEVMITDIDFERKKISLSIRALMENFTAQHEQDANAPDEIVAIAEAGNTQIAGDLIEEEKTEG